MKTFIVLILCIILALLAILFIPIPKGMLNDGGSMVYKATTYTVVSWKRLVIDMEDKSEEYYENTSVFWFPDNMKSIDELWELEMKQ